jgi:hypothetical protein
MYNVSQTDHEGLYGTDGERGEMLHPNNRGMMDIAIIDKVLSECEERRFNLNIVSLIWLGESLLHPQFLEIYEKILNFGERTGLLHSLVFNTNGSLVDEEFSNELFRIYRQNSKNVSTTITFSIDSGSEESFSILKPGGGTVLHQRLEPLYALKTL